MIIIPVGCTLVLLAGLFFLLAEYRKARPTERLPITKGTKIAVISVLKPVNDTRMYEKIGRTLVTFLPAEVHIAGYASEQLKPEEGRIFFHHLYRFRRLSFGRFLAGFKMLAWLIKSSPLIIISSSPDLYLVTFWYSVLFNVRFYLDIRENYLANVLKTPVFPFWLRYPLGYTLRFTERVAARYATGFIVAEGVYMKQLPFLKGRIALLENKIPRSLLYNLPLKPVPHKLREGSVKLLYSGTIGLHYGIFEAIDLAEALHILNPEVTLNIIGYCADLKLLRQVKNRISSLPFVFLEGGERLVNHNRLISLASECHVGLLPYRPSESTNGRIPTKLFEYLALRIPMVIQHNPEWEAISNLWGASIGINFANFEADKVLYALQNTTFYTNGIPNGIFWNEQEMLLVDFISQ